MSYKFTLQEKRFFKYASMLVKAEITHTKRQEKALKKARKVPVKVQNASFKFMCKIFEVQVKSKPVSIERIMIQNKPKSLAENSVSPIEKKQFQPEYASLANQLNERQILVPSMLEFKKGVNTVELCEIRHFIIQEVTRSQTYYQGEFEFQENINGYQFKEMVFTPEILGEVKYWLDLNKKQRYLGSTLNDVMFTFLYSKSQQFRVFKKDSYRFIGTCETKNEIVPIARSGLKPQCFEQYKARNTYQEYKGDIQRLCELKSQSGKKWLAQIIPSFENWTQGISGESLDLYFNMMKAIKKIDSSVIPEVTPALFLRFRMNYKIRVNHITTDKVNEIFGLSLPQNIELF